MTRAAIAVLAALVWTGSAHAATFQVTNVNDSGADSLRWAIGQADGSPGADTVTFAAGLSGKTIALKSYLALYGNGTTVDGDINGDGKPDIRLNGAGLIPGHDGIEVLADGCTVIGLAVGNCPRFGIMASDVGSFTLRSSHVGVSLSGNALTPNGEADVYLQRCNNCVIGGTTAAERNIIAGGSSSSGARGVRLYQAGKCTVSGNYIGLRRSGTAALGAGGIGVAIDDSTPASNAITIGGNAAGAGNRFAGLDYGIVVFDGDYGVIAGNTFGLAADGSTVVPIVQTCVRLDRGADHNRIGGTTAAERNVFAGAGTGIEFSDADTKDNTVLGNYFGLNAAGALIRRLTYGVHVTTGGAQTIGGSAPGAANYFIPTEAPGLGPCGVLVGASGGGTLVQGNHFGIRPVGGDTARRAGYGIATNATGRITGNTISSLDRGIGPYGAGAKPLILGNTIRKCTLAVEIDGGARPVLGNLGNTSTADDGGNAFATSNTWYIHNGTAFTIKAEGNTFGTTVKTQIDAKIYDKLDDATKGRVDFDPLQGGAHPTDLGATLALTGAVAIPSHSGAEIAFTLSAPSAVTVEVLNLAGRVIATPVHRMPCLSGTHRVLWSGLSATGLATPPGRYLLRLHAQDPSGRRTEALCPVTLP
jgi:hypothetical protein